MHGNSRSQTTILDSIKKAHPVWFSVVIITLDFTESETGCHPGTLGQFEILRRKATPIICILNQRTESDTCGNAIQSMMVFNVLLLLYIEILYINMLDT